MATFEYLSPGAALERFGEQRPGYEWRSVRGCRMADAERVATIRRTRGGQAKAPEGPQSEHAHGDRFRYVIAMERLTGNVDPGTVELTYLDGTREPFGGKDLICVERPVLDVHYGESRTACGERGEFDTVTEYIPAVTCKGCTAVVFANV